MYRSINLRLTIIPNSDTIRALAGSCSNNCAWPPLHCAHEESMGEFGQLCLGLGRKFRRRVCEFNRRQLLSGSQPATNLTRQDRARAMAASATLLPRFKI